MSSAKMTAKLVLETGEFVGGTKLAGNAVSLMQSGLKGLEGQVKLTADAQAKMTEVAKKQEALANSVRSFDQLSKSMGLSGREAARFGRQIGVSEKTLKSWKQQAGQASGQANKLTDSIKRIAAVAGLGSLGVGLTKLTNDSLSAATLYDSSLRSMVKVTDESSAQIDVKMQSLSPKLGNLAELTSAYYQSISAGAKDAMDMVVVASQTSVAAADDVNKVYVTQGEAIKAISKAMNAYGDEIKSAGQVSDWMFKVEKLGQTSVGELVPYLGEVGSVAKAAGVHFNDLGGSIATITQTAGTTGVGITQLKALFLEMIKPAGALSKTLKGIGVSTGKELIDKFGLVGAIKKLKVAAGPKGLMGIFGSSEAGQAAQALAANLDVVAQKTKEVAQAEGSRLKAFEARSQGMAGRAKELENIIFKAEAQIGTALDPIRAKFYQDFANFLSQNVGGIQGFAQTMAELAKSTYELGRALAPIAPYLAELFVIKKITGFALAAQAAFTGMEIATKGLTFALKGMMSATGIGLAALAAIEVGKFALDKYDKEMERRKKSLTAFQAADRAKTVEAMGRQDFADKYKGMSSKKLARELHMTNKAMRLSNNSKEMHDLQMRSKFLQTTIDAYKNGLVPTLEAIGIKHEVAVELSKKQLKLVQLRVEAQRMPIKPHTTHKLTQPKSLVASTPTDYALAARKARAKSEIKRLQDLYNGSVLDSHARYTRDLKQAHQEALQMVSKLGPEAAKEYEASRKLSLAVDHGDVSGARQQGADLGQLGKTISNGISQSGFMQAGQGIMSAASSMTSMITMIPQMVTQVMGMVDQILSSWGKIGSQVGQWVKQLPTALMNAIHGLADIIIVFFEDIAFGKLEAAIIKGLVSGLDAAFNTLFNGAPRAQSETQTKALESLAKSIGGWITDQNRKDWGAGDWTAEYKRLESEKLSLNKGSADYWDQYIKLGKQQFETLKKIQQTAEQSASTLKGVLGTLQTTLDQITGAQYNPEGLDFAGQAKKFATLLSAAKETGVSADERKKRVGELTQFSTGYLDNAKAQLRSSAGYKDVYDAVVSGLEGAKTLVAGELSSINDQQGQFSVLGEAQSLQTETQSQVKVVGEEEGIFSQIAKTLTWIWEMVTNIDGGIKTLTGIYHGAIRFLSDIYTKVIAFGQGFYDTLLTIPEALYDGVKNLWDSAWKSVAGIGTVFYGQLRAFFNPYLKIIGQAIGGIYNVILGVKSAVDGALVALYDLPNSIADALKTGAKSLSKWASKTWKKGLSLSDNRLKTNVTKGQEILPGVQSAQWTWNQEANKMGLFGQSSGVIAQDLEKVLPGLVHQVGRFKQVDYAGLAQAAPGFASQLPGYADGGVSYGPQLAWVSEGAHAAEAHVPLPNGKSIPVEIKQPQGGKGNGELARLLKEVSAKLDRLKEISQRTGTLVDVTRAKRDSGPVVIDLGSLESGLSNKAAERGQRGNLQFSRG